jgi:putative intracellular protease/amidase
MAKEIEGLRVAVLATDGFEQTELTEPVKALHHLDVQVDVVSPRSGQIQGMQHKVRVAGRSTPPTPAIMRGSFSPAGSPIRTNYASTRARFASSASSSTPRSQSPRSATARGH